MTENKNLNPVTVAIIAGIVSAGLVVGGLKLGLFSIETNGKHAHSEKMEKHEHAGHGHDEKADRHSENHGHDGHSDHEEEENIRLSQDEMKELEIETAQAGPGKLRIEISLPGEISLNPDRLAHLVPRASGIVRQVGKTLGDTVKAGEIMAWLESAELGETKVEYLGKQQNLELAKTDLSRIKTIHDNTFKMLNLLETSPSLEQLKQVGDLEMGKNRSLLISVYAQLKFAKAMYKREKKLYNEGKITSESEFLTAESNLKKGEADYLATRDSLAFEVKRALIEAERMVRVADFELKSSRTHLNLLGINNTEIEKLAQNREDDERLGWYALTAPISGTVIEKHITLGEMLSNDAKAFTIADFSQVWAYLNVYPKYLTRIQKGQNVIISGGMGVPPVSGTISYLVPLVGEKTRTALARVVLPNLEGNWRPGSFVTAKVSVEEVGIPILIPKTALQTVEDQKVVFVKTDKGFKPQPVKIGRTDFHAMEIISGLDAGQVYVKKGGFALKAELAKGSFGDGHGH